MGTEVFVSFVAHKLSGGNDLPSDVVTCTEIREMQKLKSHQGFFSEINLDISWDLEGR